VFQTTLTSQQLDTVIGHRQGRHHMTSTHQTSTQRQKRSILGAFVGTAIEWYDFFSFGTAAALVFGTVF